MLVHTICSFVISCVKYVVMKENGRISFTGVYIRAGMQFSLGGIFQNDFVNNCKSFWELCVRGDSEEQTWG